MIVSVGRGYGRCDIFDLSSCMENVTSCKFTDSIPPTSKLNKIVETIDLDNLNDRHPTFNNFLLIEN